MNNKLHIIFTFLKYKTQFPYLYQMSGKTIIEKMLILEEDMEYLFSSKNRLRVI